MTPELMYVKLIPVRDEAGHISRIIQLTRVKVLVTTDDVIVLLVIRHVMTQSPLLFTTNKAAKISACN